MKKLKLLALVLILLYGCSNTEVKESETQKETVVGNVVTPTEIIKNLEKNRDLESFESGEKKENSEKTEVDLRPDEKKNLELEIKEETKTSENEVLVEEDSTPKPSSKEEKPKEKNTTSKKLERIKAKGNKAVSNFVNLEMLKHSNIGIEIREIESGEIVGEYNKSTAITPASVMKIVTSATALEVLGKDTRLETKVVYDGDISTEGVLSGNIYILGGGDPTLGSDGIKREQTAFMKEWVGKVKSSGIKRVEGDIIVVDNLFGYVGVEEKWLWEDFGTSYGQGTYGISVFDNLYTLYLSSDSEKVSVVGTKPKINGLKFENRLKISPKGRKDFSVRGLAFENKRVLNGEVPANQKRIATKTDIPNPALFLGEYFKSSLKESGVTINGKVKTARETNKRPKNPKLIAVTKSVTVEEMVKVLLERSDNHYTEHLYQLLKLKKVDIDEFWQERGVDTKALVMNDGSGLSRGDYLSASILTDILFYMYKEYPDFEKLLARGGYDGTVYDFLEPKVFDGSVRVKSGSMSGIQSYTGFVEKDGKKYVFTIIVNHWNGSRNRLKDEMEKLIKNLF